MADDRATTNPSGGRCTSRRRCSVTRRRVPRARAVRRPARSPTRPRPRPRRSGLRGTAPYRRRARPAPCAEPNAVSVCSAGMGRARVASCCELLFSRVRPGFRVGIPLQYSQHDASQNTETRVPAWYSRIPTRIRQVFWNTEPEYPAGIKIPKKIGIPAWYSGIPEVAGIPMEYRAGFLPER